MAQLGRERALTLKGWLVMLLRCSSLQHFPKCLHKLLEITSVTLILKEFLFILGETLDFLGFGLS